MLTAKAGLDNKIEGLETGIDAYLTKPFSAERIEGTGKESDSSKEGIKKEIQPGNDNKAFRSKCCFG